MTFNRKTPVAYRDGREVAWLTNMMWEAGIDDRIVCQENGYYVVHEEEIQPCPLTK